MSELLKKTSSEAPLALNIQQSLSGRRWLWRMPSFCDSSTLDRHAQHIAQKASLYDIVGRMIAVRGVSPQAVEHFLEPKLKNLLPDPSCLKNMDKAADRIAKAVIQQEKIAIFGDYDVDGGCSSAILTQFFNDLHLSPIVYIPDRIKEGYGPNAPALQSLIDQGVTLIICVDCGAASHQVFDAIPQDKTDIIVLDHHKCETAPSIFASVNPNQLDCNSGLGYLCAGGVSFLACIAVTRALQQKQYFDNHSKPDLLNLLDLVALSTICDVMPLTGLNRALVTQGLKILGKRERIGLAALLEVSGVQKAPDAFSCGFALGPRINAGGRISESNLGLRLLTCHNPVEAHQLAERLDTINKQRQNIEQGVLQQATDLALEQHEKGSPVIMLHHSDWHPGIVGIVAGRIKEQINRPTLIGAELSDGTIKGSGRSIIGLDLGAAIIAAKQAGLLLHGGGHAMAAGYSYRKDQTEILHQFLNEYLSKAAQAPSVVDLEIEGVTTIAGATVELAKQIERLTPFGNGNDEPLIVLSHVHILRSDRIGKDSNTLRLTLQGENGSSIKALIFKADQNPITPYLEDYNNRRPMHLAGWLRTNSWNGRENADFFIKDAAFA